MSRDEFEEHVLEFRERIDPAAGETLRVGDLYFDDKRIGSVEPLIGVDDGDRGRAMVAFERLAGFRWETRYHDAPYDVRPSWGSAPDARRARRALLDYVLPYLRRWLSTRPESGPFLVGPGAERLRAELQDAPGPGPNG